MIAESIIAAAAEIGPLKHPMVVRLQGTNSEAGLKLVSSTTSNFGPRQCQKQTPVSQRPMADLWNVRLPSRDWVCTLRVSSAGPLRKRLSLRLRAWERRMDP